MEIEHIIQWFYNHCHKDIIMVVVHSLIRIIYAWFHNANIVI